MISAEENDQFAGANVGRAHRSRPRPAATASPIAVQLRGRPDRRAAGEHQAACSRAHAEQHHAVRHRAAGRVDLRPRPARPRTTRRSASSSATRAAMTAHNPYSGRRRREDRRTTRPARSSSASCTCRRPTRCGRRRYTLFPKPDYFFAHAPTCGTPTAAIERSTRLRLRPRLLQPEHRHHLGRHGRPGRRRRERRRRPASRPSSRRSTDPNVDGPCPQASTRGTWVEETDIRPTMLHLLGLTDDYRRTVT